MRKELIMKRKWRKQIVASMLVSMMLLLSLETTALAKWDVKPSNVSYTVEIKDAYDIFIGNRKTIGTEVGTEYYMNYTVAKSDVEQYAQQGIAGATRIKTYPYLSEGNDGGFYKFSENTNKLLVEGNTYLLKFTITEDGYEYRVGWARDDKSTYIKFAKEIGDIRTNLGYFGVVFADVNMNVKLTNVHFYDKTGKDLGLTSSNPQAVKITKDVGLMAKDKHVQHSYSVKVENATDLAISNRRAATSDVVYMEYKVKSSKGTHINQPGVILSNKPKERFPYLDGNMYLDTYEYDPTKVDASPLFIEGAEYIIRFEKLEDEYDVAIQYTLNGKRSLVSFASIYGLYDKESAFFSLWSGDGVQFPVNIELVDFKCYDSNKNNLGVQCNDVNKYKCEIIHHGELEDYAGCEAVYYCDEDESLYALYEDKSLKFTLNDETKNGDYRIESEVMTTNIEATKKDYNYMYYYFKDENEQTYRRLQTYKVTFETGTGTSVDEQVLDAENGYKALRPTDPKLEGNTFEGWYTAEGEQYDFENIVSESITLYAKWSDTEYMSSGKLVDNVSTVLLIGCSTLFLIAAVAVGVVQVTGKGKHDDRDKSKNK